jgi:hypothetical protein
MIQEKSIILKEVIESKIYLIRGKKVMFDFDLADMYGVETKVLNQAVKRNIERFPEDFMFQINEQEMKNWRSRIVTPNPGYKMGLRYSPFVFTEQGVSMLSSVLRSKTAVQVNIAIMRTFTKLREMILTNKDLREKIERLEIKFRDHDQKFKSIFIAIKQLVKEEQKPKKEIGFRLESKK